MFSKTKYFTYVTFYVETIKFLQKVPVIVFNEQKQLILIQVNNSLLAKVIKC